MSNYGKHYGADDIEELKAKSNLWLYIIIIAAGMLAAALIWWILNPQPQPAQQQWQQQPQPLQALPTYTPFPTPTPLPIVKVEDLNQNIRLQKRGVFAEYRATKVVTIDNQSWFRLRGEVFVFEAHGVVPAGLDFTHFRENSFEVRGNSVTIYPPTPQIFGDMGILTRESQVAFRQSNLFSEIDPNLETQLRNEIETQLINEAIEHGILHSSKVSAEQWLHAWARTFGFENVHVVWP